MKKEFNVVGYVRYSSDLQREESIEAQKRAITDFCKKEGYTILRFYEDRAQSAKTDNRTAFKKMIEDSSKREFQAVVVHKLDRFARNRYDSAHNKYLLKANNVSLFSATERIDSSPESVIMESVLEGMAEYYILNLAREVEKGKKENAYKCQHVGGIAPLGYDVDKTTRKLVINQDEAIAVKLIFKKIIDGCSYTEIITELNTRGFKTKAGGKFGKNSLFSILKNEKYCGTYVYNKSAKANQATGKRNGHAYKNEEEIIRIENGCPALITKDEYNKVQELLKIRQKRAGAFRAKETYLLTGKIVCGECGSAYVGNSRHATDTHPQYVSYRCTHKNGKVKCHTSEINRDLIDNCVIGLVSKIVFDESQIKGLVASYKEYYNSQDDEYTAEINRLSKALASVNSKISNTVNAISAIGFSQALADSLKNFEEEKSIIENQLNEVEAKVENNTLTENSIIEAFNKVKAEFDNGTLKGMREIISLFVDKVIVYSDRVEVVLTYGNDLLKITADEYNRKATALRLCIRDKLNDIKKENTIIKNCVFRGGEGEI